MSWKKGDNFSFLNVFDFNKFGKRFSEANVTAMRKTALYMATVMTTERPKPPIKTGHLRRSYSVYHNKEIVHKGLGDGGLQTNVATSNLDEKPIPINELKTDNNTILFIYNTIYARRQHEKKGKFPSQELDPAVGAGFVSLHLINQASNFGKVYSSVLKKDVEGTIPTRGNNA